MTDFINGDDHSGYEGNTKRNPADVLNTQTPVPRFPRRSQAHHRDEMVNFASRIERQVNLIAMALTIDLPSPNTMMFRARQGVNIRIRQTDAERIGQTDES